MLIVSNNLEKVGFAFQPDTIVRLNLAWVKSEEEAKQILSNIKNPVYLDYPEGRKKPPRPTISFEDACNLARLFDVRFFAISNVESPDDVRRVRGMVWEHTELVPKIESEKGVRNIPLLASTGVRMIMLDKEDLYTDIKADPDKFNELVELARTLGKENNIKVLELQGVIFA